MGDKSCQLAVKIKKLCVLYVKDGFLRGFVREYDSALVIFIYSAGKFFSTFDE